MFTFEKSEVVPATLSARHSKIPFTGVPGYTCKLSEMAVCSKMRRGVRHTVLVDAENVAGFDGCPLVEPLNSWRRGARHGAIQVEGPVFNDKHILGSYQCSRGFQNG